MYISIRFCMYLFTRSINRNEIINSRSSARFHPPLAHTLVRSGSADMRASSSSSRVRTKPSFRTKERVPVYRVQGTSYECIHHPYKIQNHTSGQIPTPYRLFQTDLDQQIRQSTPIKQTHIRVSPQNQIQTHMS